MDPAAVFGASLRRLRDRRGLSQRQLGKAVHLDHSVLSRYENGARLPDIDLVERLDALLDAEGALLALLPAAAATDLPDPASEDADRRAWADGVQRPPSGLPPLSRHFLGRDAEIEAVLAAVTAATDAPPPDPVGPAALTAPVVHAVHGMAGSGKTALAVRTARQALDAFPDGCLYLDLNGHTADTEPMPPAEALSRLLRRLGVGGAHIPAGTGERSALFRAMTEDLALLLVLDNARSTRQVLPLLPSGPRCAVLVTSRSRLIALDDAEHLALGPLRPADSLDLFRSLARVPDTSATRAACETIVRRCGHLPLAVRIAAARARHSPLRELSDRLTDEYERLAELDDGERSVVAALESSLSTLPDDQREMFALLGLHPDEPFDALTAAALAATTEGEARRLLEGLHDAGLLLRSAADRYRFHDLVGAVSRTSAAVRLPAGRRDAALRSLLDHTLRGCTEADLLISPHRHRFPSAAGPARPGDRAFAGYEEALAWLTDNLSALTQLCGTALRNGLAVHCWQLAYALRGVYFLGRHWDAWERSHTWAVDAARACGDRTAEAVSLGNAGLARSTRGRLEPAAELLDRAIAAARASGDRFAETTVLAHHAWVLHRRGRHAQALAEQHTVLAFRRGNGLPRNLAIALRDAAVMERAAGVGPAAEEHLTEALALFTALDMRLDAAMALNVLGDFAAQDGRPDDATRHFARALEAARACGSSYERARAHHGLGLLAAARGPDRRLRAEWHLNLAQRQFTALRAESEAARVAADAARHGVLRPPSGHSPPSAAGTPA
ncbi:helix-turn-helix domain-containing protein [Streptomyces sp. IBSBF 2953]|uniref:helix-turn-helix domain-containing protein n=1 Tax=Streptomyces TaxID=1883 RepID=UPI002119DEF0|nr:helix-turn-helix domain-containing protein [Streptomyces scabiei]MCQ9181271.1 helix-turn-helix domain-containing protein [Streptomyces hayashii]MDX3114130.1 helix-turn-helix domain-containing protein [Streptomyces scabiei]